MEYDNYRAAMEMITEIFDIETVKWERRKPFPLAFCIPILCCVCPAYADIGDALSDDYVVSFECPHCGEIVWGENWIRKTGTNLLSLSQCSDGQEYLISLKFRPVAGNKIVVKRRVYVLTDELRTDYQQCVEQAAAWSKYVIPAYSF